MGKRIEVAACSFIPEFPSAYPLDIHPLTSVSLFDRRKTAAFRIKFHLKWQTEMIFDSGNSLPSPACIGTVYADQIR
jgi:hypothetical protein